ncbi:MAG: hypothetical protein Tsb0013_25140 [Phycisphaerales bacterium]
MPWYEYRCEANGRTVEAMHTMDRTLATWGELCEVAGEDPGDTDPTSPVEKAFNAHLAIAKGSPTGPDPARGGAGPCGPSCGCHPH